MNPRNANRMQVVGGTLHQAFHRSFEDRKSRRINFHRTRVHQRRSTDFGCLQESVSIDCWHITGFRDVGGIEDILKILGPGSGHELEMPSGPQALVREGLELAWVAPDRFLESFQGWFRFGYGRWRHWNGCGTVTVVEVHVLVAHAIIVELINSGSKPVRRSDWVLIDLLEVQGITLRDKQDNLKSKWQGLRFLRISKSD